jgi:hypothetical protein
MVFETKQNWQKKLAFLTQNKNKIMQKMIITGQFFAQNWQKSQKIVIMTLVPGHPTTCLINGLTLRPHCTKSITKICPKFLV